VSENRDSSSKPTTGQLVWAVKPQVSGPSENTDLGEAFRRLVDWPADGFVKSWFVHEYRRLTIVNSQPDDTDIVVNCHSRPVSTSVVVRIEPRRRSSGAARVLTATERATAATHDFSVDDSGLLVGEFNRLEQGVETLANQVKSVVDDVFGKYSMLVEFELTRDSRLDQLHTFMGIEPPELVAIIKAIGYQPSLEITEDGTPTIRVDGPGVFTIVLDGLFDRNTYQTLDFLAMIPVVIDPIDVMRLNARLTVGGAWTTGDGRLVMHFRYNLSGGTTDVAIANRVEEWVAALGVMAEWVSEAGSLAPATEGLL
jgi:hypothetical protein